MISNINGNSAEINVQLSTDFHHEYINTRSTDDLIRNPRRDESSLDNDRLSRVLFLMPLNVTAVRQVFQKRPRNGLCTAK